MQPPDIRLCFTMSCLLLASCLYAGDLPSGTQNVQAKAQANVSAAVEALERDEVGRCIALLREAIQLDPDLAEARVYLAVVLAYGTDRLEEAARELEQLLAKKPDHAVARLHVAIIRAMLYVPGDTSEQNVRAGNQALADFRRVLEHDPNNWLALDATGALLFQLASRPFDAPKLVEARQQFLRHISVRPEMVYLELYYWVGVIDWTLAYRGNAEMRAEYNKANIKKQVKDTEPLPAKVREEYAAKYGALVDEGIKNLQQAINFRPDYDDAMGYLNLLYRRRADMVESAEERADLLKQADDLVEKVKEIKQKKRKEHKTEVQQSPTLGQPPRAHKPRLLAWADFELVVLETLVLPPPPPPPPRHR